MICAETREVIEVRRKAFIRKWRLKHRAVADSLEEAGDRLFSFTRLPPSQWRSARTTDEMDKRFFGASNELEETAASPFFCSTALPPFFRPDHHLAGRCAQGRSRLAASAATGRLGLDWPEHGGILDWMWSQCFTRPVSYRRELEQARTGDYHLVRGRPRGEERRVGCKRRRAALFVPC